VDPDDAGEDGEDVTVLGSVAEIAVTVVGVAIFALVIYCIAVFGLAILVVAVLGGPPGCAICICWLALW